MNANEEDFFYLFCIRRFCVNKWWHNAKSGANVEWEWKKLVTPRLINTALIQDAEKMYWQLEYLEDWMVRVEGNNWKKQEKNGAKENWMVSEATACVVPWYAKAYRLHEKTHPAPASLRRQWRPTFPSFCVTFFIKLSSQFLMRSLYPLRRIIFVEILPIGAFVRAFH